MLGWCGDEQRQQHVVSRPAVGEIERSKRIEANQVLNRLIQRLHKPIERSGEALNISQGSTQGRVVLGWGMGDTPLGSATCTTDGCCPGEAG